MYVVGVFACMRVPVVFPNGPCQNCGSQNHEGRFGQVQADVGMVMGSIMAVAGEKRLQAGVVEADMGDQHDGYAGQIITQKTIVAVFFPSGDKTYGTEWKH